MYVPVNNAKLSFISTLYDTTPDILITNFMQISLIITQATQHFIKSWQNYDKDNLIPFHLLLCATWYLNLIRNQIGKFSIWKMNFPFDAFATADAVCIFSRLGNWTNEQKKKRFTIFFLIRNLNTISVHLFWF